MDPRQSRIKQIFSDAIDLQEPERSVFLDSACQDDVEMRAEVEKLLSSFHEPEQLLDRS